MIRGIKGITLFSPRDETEIIGWINFNLLINRVSYNGDFIAIETSLIETHKLILNIAKNPYSMPELSKLRAECVKVANL